MDDHTGGPLVVAGTGGAVGLAAAARQVVGAGGASAPSASARRWARVRGSSSHTPWAISVSGDPASRVGVQPAPQRGGAGVLIGITDA
uniref:hypothetical protein n=1 Tax=Mycobacterium tuberculosis TaxID=1773 RepID=UPI003F58830D